MKVSNDKNVKQKKTKKKNEHISNNSVFQGGFREIKNRTIIRPLYF